MRKFSCYLRSARSVLVRWNTVLGSTRINQNLWGNQKNPQHPTHTIGFKHNFENILKVSTWSELCGTVQRDQGLVTRLIWLPLMTQTRFTTLATYPPLFHSRWVPIVCTLATHHMILFGGPKYDPVWSQPVLNLGSLHEQSVTSLLSATSRRCNVFSAGARFARFAHRHSMCSLLQVCRRFHGPKV